MRNALFWILVKLCQASSACPSEMNSIKMEKSESDEVVA